MGPMQISAALVDEVNGPFTVRDIELDDPGPGEVLVRVVASGVCHTDENTRRGNMPMPLPGVLGHEGAGVVTAVGAGVDSVAVGDRVVLGWPFCGGCANCLAGQPRYCERVGEAVVGGHRLLGPKAGQSGYRRADGTPVSGHFFGQSSFATHSLAQANAVVRVPEEIPLELVGPLACGIATGAGAVLNTARPQVGASLVIYGAGAVGLAAVMAATNTPATRIVAVDVHDSRLELARQFGATDTINSTGVESVSEAVRERLGAPADFALDCTGIISVVEQTIATVGMRGTAILIGGAPAGATFTTDHFSTVFGKRIVGVLGGEGRSHVLIPALIELYRQGRFPFDRLIQYYDFDQLEEAIAASHRGEVIKPVVRISPEEQPG
ncbi:aryl-alcohol dehydrogenase [Propionibacteriaceae bacterium ES.041]|nr:aryl-alcohol dehydrogenase [Propionibacteriaceae bacterium ES.041]